MSTNKPYEDPALLAGLFIYDAETGRLFHAVDRAYSRVKAGSYADTSANRNGYRTVSVRLAGKTRNVYAHRVAWILSHGAIPADLCIDHVNGVRDDNRLCNLRLVTPQGNSHNNHCVRGYAWHTKASKWMAQINVDGRHIYLGLHDTPEAARAAHLAAKAQLHPTAPLHLYH